MEDLTPKFEIEDIDKFSKDVADIVKKFSGLNHLELTVEIYEGRFGAEFMKIRSNELVDYMYPKMFKSLKVTEFGGNWSHPAHRYWLPLHYSYVHFGLGTNGSKLCYLSIDKYGNILEVSNELEERK